MHICIYIENSGEVLTNGITLHLLEIRFLLYLQRFSTDPKVTLYNFLIRGKLCDICMLDLRYKLET